MHIVPVIDLLNGIVVHAKQGNRAHYQAIQSLLTSSSHPVDIVKAFQALYPFKTLYIADLNAIQNIDNTGQCHQQILAEIHQAFPTLTLWIDAGIHDIDTAKQWQKPYTKLILGSESLTDLAQYQALSAALNQDFTLSLDFSPQGYLGPEPLLAQSQYWPQAVIAMTLSQVGANAGVEINTIQQVLSQANHHAIYAAGGVRGSQDLQQLKAHGVSGALIASTLHRKQLSTTELTTLNA